MLSVLWCSCDVSFYISLEKIVHGLQGKIISKTVVAVWGNKTKLMMTLACPEVFLMKFCHNYTTGYLQLNINQLPCNFLILLLVPKLQYILMRFQRRGCGMQNRKSQEEHEEPSLLPGGIVMNILSGAGLLDSVNCASSKQRLGVTRREPLA